MGSGGLTVTIRDSQKAAVAQATTQFHWQDPSLSTESSRGEKPPTCSSVLGVSGSSPGRSVLQPRPFEKQADIVLFFPFNQLKVVIWSWTQNAPWFKVMGFTDPLGFFFFFFSPFLEFHASGLPNSTWPGLPGLGWPSQGHQSNWNCSLWSHYSNQGTTHIETKETWFTNCSLHLKWKKII